MKQVAVNCINLTKSFADTLAVSQLDLTVMVGEILAVLGPSGCGKTTTLRLIAGFEIPDEGYIEIGGLPVAASGKCLPPEQRQVGMVFQNYALFPHLTVAENIGYGLRRSAEREARIREVIALGGLDGLDARMPHELSGGQQQRVALARALAPRPQVLLLDEPFSNLDAGRRIQMREEVRAILKASGTASVFVTHDQDEALFMGDRVLVQNAGRVEQVGTPDEVFAEPASRFVAEFMGQSDFLPGEVTADGVQTEIGMLRQTLALPVGAQVDVALRADDVILSSDPQAAARIVARHFRGIVNVYRVQLPSGRIVHSLEAHTLSLDPGMPVNVQMDPDHPLACFPRNGVAAHPDK